MRSQHKWMHLLLAGILLVSSIPFEFIHHFLEEHEDEIHVCDYDVCIREFTHDCEFDDQIVTKKFALTTSGNFNFLLPSDKVLVARSTFEISQTSFRFQIRGPPSFIV